jgi:hypothetical protein
MEWSGVIGYGNKKKRHTDDPYVAFFYGVDSANRRSRQASSYTGTTRWVDRNDGMVGTLHIPFRHTGILDVIEMRGR